MKTIILKIFLLSVLTLVSCKSVKQTIVLKAPIKQTINLKSKPLQIELNNQDPPLILRRVFVKRCTEVKVKVKPKLSIKTDTSLEKKRLQIMAIKEGFKMYKKWKREFLEEHRNKSKEEKRVSKEVKEPLVTNNTSLFNILGKLFVPYLLFKLGRKLYKT